MPLPDRRLPVLARGQRVVQLAPLPLVHRHDGMQLGQHMRRIGIAGSA